MIVVVTLSCTHPDGFSDHRDETGKRLFITSDGAVLLDGRRVAWRDRRRITSREPGHPWVSSKPDRAWEDPKHQRLFEAWTHLRIRVDL